MKVSTFYYTLSLLISCYFVFSRSTPPAFKGAFSTLAIMSIVLFAVGSQNKK